MRCKFIVAVDIPLFLLPFMTYFHKSVRGGGWDFIILQFLYVNLRQMYAAKKGGQAPLGPCPPPLDATCLILIYHH